MLNKFLNSFDIKDLERYEAKLIQFLLYGIADENEEIVGKCFRWLEEYGYKLN